MNWSESQTGYTQTWPQLSWSTWGSATTVNIIGPHAPSPASSLTELLGRRVSETRVALHDAPLAEPPTM